MAPVNRAKSRHFGNNQHKKPKVGPGEFDLEKARHEVFMLGIKGLGHKDKREAKRELAIKLGAIPKKKRGKNIKQHMEEVRERKRKEQQEREEKAQMGIFDTKKSRKSRPKKDLNEVHSMDYQIGRFKNGIQHLRKEEIERIKRRK